MLGLFGFRNPPNSDMDYRTFNNHIKMDYRIFNNHIKMDYSQYRTFNNHIKMDYSSTGLLTIT